MYVDIVISNVFNLNKHFFFLPNTSRGVGCCTQYTLSRGVGCCTQYTLCRGVGCCTRYTLFRGVDCCTQYTLSRVVGCCTKCTLSRCEKRVSWELSTQATEFNLRTNVSL